MTEKIKLSFDDACKVGHQLLAWQILGEMIRAMEKLRIEGKPVEINFRIEFKEQTKGKE